VVAPALAAVAAFFFTAVLTLPLGFVVEEGFGVAGFAALGFAVAGFATLGFVVVAGFVVLGFAVLGHAAVCFSRRSTWLFCCTRLFFVILSFVAVGFATAFSLVAKRRVARVWHRNCHQWCVWIVVTIIIVGIVIFGHFLSSRLQFLLFSNCGCQRLCHGFWLATGIWWCHQPKGGEGGQSWFLVVAVVVVIVIIVIINAEIVVVIIVILKSLPVSINQQGASLVVSVVGTWFHGINYQTFPLYVIIHYIRSNYQAGSHAPHQAAKAQLVLEKTDDWRTTIFSHTAITPHTFISTQFQ
jgi:hypothetical protein